MVFRVENYRVEITREYREFPIEIQGHCGTQSYGERFEEEIRVINGGFRIYLELNAMRWLVFNFS